MTRFWLFVFLLLLVPNVLAQVTGASNITVKLKTKERLQIKAESNDVSVRLIEVVGHPRLQSALLIQKANDYSWRIFVLVTDQGEKKCSTPSEDFEPWEKTVPSLNNLQILGESKAWAVAPNPYDWKTLEKDLSKNNISIIKQSLSDAEDKYNNIADLRDNLLGSNVDNFCVTRTISWDKLKTLIGDETTTDEEEAVSPHSEVVISEEPHFDWKKTREGRAAQRHFQAVTLEKLKEVQAQVDLTETRASDLKFDVANANDEASIELVRQRVIALQDELPKIKQEAEEAMNEINGAVGKLQSSEAQASENRASSDLTDEQARALYTAISGLTHKAEGVLEKSRVGHERITTTADKIAEETASLIKTLDEKIVDLPPDPRPDPNGTNWFIWSVLLLFYILAFIYLVVLLFKILDQTGRHHKAMFRRFDQFEDKLEKSRGGVSEAASRELFSESLDLLRRSEIRLVNDQPDRTVVEGIRTLVSLGEERSKKLAESQREVATLREKIEAEQANTIKVQTNLNEEREGGSALLRMLGVLAWSRLGYWSKGEFEADDATNYKKYSRYLQDYMNESAPRREYGQLVAELSTLLNSVGRAEINGQHPAYWNAAELDKLRQKTSDIMGRSGTRTLSIDKKTGEPLAEAQIRANLLADWGDHLWLLPRAVLIIDTYFPDAAFDPTRLALLNLSRRLHYVMQAHGIFPHELALIALPEDAERRIDRDKRTTVNAALEGIPSYREQIGAQLNDGREAAVDVSEWGYDQLTEVGGERSLSLEKRSMLITKNPGDHLG